MIFRILVLFALFLSTGCTRAVTAPQAMCRFVYDSRFITNTVIPIIKGRYGDRYTFFNLKDPVISTQNKYVRLVFGQSKPSEGYMPLDTANFVIVVDPCTSRVVKSYETSSSPSTSGIQQ